MGSNSYDFFKFVSILSVTILLTLPTYNMNLNNCIIVVKYLYGHGFKFYKKHYFIYINIRIYIDKYGTYEGI